MSLDLKLQENTPRFRNRILDPETTSLVGYNLLGLAGTVASYLITQDSNIDTVVPSVIAGAVTGGVIGGAGGEILGLYMQNNLGSERRTRKENSPQQHGLIEKLRTSYRRLITKEPIYSEFKYHQDLSMERRVLAAYRLRNHFLAVEAGQSKRKKGYMEEKRIDPIHLLYWSSNKLKEKSEENKVHGLGLESLIPKAMSDGGYQKYALSKKKWKDIFLSTASNCAFLVMSSRQIRQCNIDARFLLKTFDENSETAKTFLENYDKYVLEHPETEEIKEYRVQVLDPLPPSMTKGFIGNPYI